MNLEVLKEFLAEDADIQVRRLLLAAIREGLESNSSGAREFTFNRFSVTLDFSTKQVMIEDDLTVGLEGEYRLGMTEFKEVLQ